MAEGKIVRRQIVKYEVEDNVQLTLSKEEARFLGEVLRHVGGDPERSPRRYQRGISTALGEALGWRTDLSDSPTPPTPRLKVKKNVHFKDDE